MAGYKEILKASYFWLIVSLVNSISASLLLSLIKGPLDILGVSLIWFVFIPIYGVVILLVFFLIPLLTSFLILLFNKYKRFLIAILTVVFLVAIWIDISTIFYVSTDPEGFSFIGFYLTYMIFEVVMFVCAFSFPVILAIIKNIKLFSKNAILLGYVISLVIVFMAIFPVFILRFQDSIVSVRRNYEVNKLKEKYVDIELTVNYVPEVVTKQFPRSYSDDYAIDTFFCADSNHEYLIYQHPKNKTDLRISYYLGLFPGLKNEGYGNDINFQIGEEAHWVDINGTKGILVYELPTVEEPREIEELVWETEDLFVSIRVRNCEGLKPQELIKIAESMRKG